MALVLIGEDGGEMGEGDSGLFDDDDGLIAEDRGGVKVGVGEGEGASIDARLLVVRGASKDGRLTAEEEIEEEG